MQRKLSLGILLKIEGNSYKISSSFKTLNIANSEKLDSEK